MAEFKIDGRMKVKKLKELFKEEYQGTLRVYNGSKIADDNDTLASIRGNEGAKEESFVCRASRTVGKFIEDMWNTFGIKVKVASPDDWVLVLDGITLSKLKDIPNNARKADMEALIAYKRDDKEEDSHNTEITSESNNETKTVTVRVEAKAMMLRLCIVKDPEELEALYNDDRSELEELINNELGSEDSEYFEENIYDWYIMRCEDVDNDMLVTVISDDEEENIYEGNAGEFLIKHQCNLGSIEPEYDDDEDEINLKFLENLNIEDEVFDEYRKRIINDEDVSMPQFPLVRKQLTGEFYHLKTSKDVHYAGYRFIKDVCFDYQIEIPKDEDFDIHKFNFFSDYETSPDFLTDDEEEWALEYALYGNKVIRGEIVSDSNAWGEPVYMFMIEDKGYFNKSFAFRVECE